MRKLLERNGICQWLFNLHEFITKNEYEIDKINLAFDDGAYNLSNDLNNNQLVSNSIQGDFFLSFNQR